MLSSTVDVSPSFFFEDPRNCRISRILPIIEREGRRGEERDAQTTIRFSPKRGVTSLSLSPTITKCDDGDGGEVGEGGGDEDETSQ